MYLCHGPRQSILDLANPTGVAEWANAFSPVKSDAGLCNCNSRLRGVSSNMPSEHSVIVASIPESSRCASSVLLTNLGNAQKDAVLLSGKGKFHGRKEFSARVQIPRLHNQRGRLYRHIAGRVKSLHVSRIICLPQCSDDLMTASAVADITGAPLGLYLSKTFQDHSDPTAADLLKPTIQKARICFCPSESLRAYYQKQFARRIWLLPAESTDPTDVVRFFRDSLALGTAVDDRYEKLLGDAKDRLTPYVEDDIPSDIYWEFRADYGVMVRLKKAGYRPDFICDVGASTGMWSELAYRCFPMARYYLIDPLIDKYLEANGAIYRSRPQFERISAAVGQTGGYAKMHVSQDLYGSSLLDATHFPDSRDFEEVEVMVSTLDDIAAQHGIHGRGILKVDMQFAEYAVLEGAVEFLKQVDFIFVETNIKVFVPGTKTFSQIVDLLRANGFECFDFGGEWRDPVTGYLLQKDVVFCRGDS
jgi:FkbM family methyltransferase